MDPIFAQIYQVRPLYTKIEAKRVDEELIQMELDMRKASIEQPVSPEAEKILLVESSEATVKIRRSQKDEPTKRSSQRVNTPSNTRKGHTATSFSLQPLPPTEISKNPPVRRRFSPFIRIFADNSVRVRIPVGQSSTGVAGSA